MWRLFGLNDFNMIDFPIKISGIKISRYVAKSKSGECTRCFPHGNETLNSHIKNIQRSWKEHRKNKWRTIK